MEIKIKDILDATNGELILGSENIILKGISIDSRKIGEGYLFIPIKGERFDGHSFIKDAFSTGAIATLTSKSIDVKTLTNKCIIKVDDTLKALQNIAKYFLKKVNIPVVAITGSTGKTTTKEFIYNVLSQKYNVLKNEGNFNNHIGLPLTLLKVENSHDIVVLEMGMSNKGEIDTLANLTKPDVGVITNIGVSHIENLGSREEIFKAKMEIANYMDSNSVLIVNGDDDFLNKLKEISSDFKTYFVGLNDDNNIYVTNINSSDINEVRFSINIENKVYDIKLNVPGVHNIYNALLAIAVGLNFRIPIEDIIVGLSNYTGSKMRLNILKLADEITVINDCYNASPDSMRAALDVLNKIKGKRKIAILGDMFEMGDYSEEAHNQVGYMVSRRNIDLLITVGKKAKTIGQSALEKGLSKNQVIILENNRKVIEMLRDIIKTGDSILIKGSRGMKMEEIVHFLQERS